jgi:hypothetical protein
MLFAACLKVISRTSLGSLLEIVRGGGGGWCEMATSLRGGLRIQLTLEMAFRRAGRKLVDNGENTADCDFVRTVLLISDIATVTYSYEL